MASIVYRKSKKSGITYAYRQESYRDPETKKPRNTRTYLGRVNEETGEIIPKGWTDQAPIPLEPLKEVERLSMQIKSLQKQLEEKEEEIQMLKELVGKIGELASSI